MPENIKASPEQTENMALFSFKGRIGRAQFWGTVLILNLLGLFIFIPIGIGMHGPDEATAVMCVIFYFLFLIPFAWIGLATQVKRWHDRGKSGAMVLINVIWIIGWIWTFVELGCLRGSEGENQYGLPPV